MLQEFPTNERHNRLRCYGYGVPNLERAIWSAGNAATLIRGVVAAVRQSRRIAEDQGHASPPTAVAKQCVARPRRDRVRMRVTLSYFIEPSPGRRGWTRKHRYQSHGLRFEVKHPLETDDAFHKRISRAAWEEDEGS